MKHQFHDEDQYAVLMMADAQNMKRNPRYNTIMRNHDSTKVPVVVRGVEHESKEACARYYGVTVRAVYHAVSVGKQDLIGLNKRAGSVKRKRLQ